jgi:NAD(P)H-hydrate epimerase
MNVLNICHDDLSRVFYKLPDRNNKGRMGRVLCVCGSYDPSGVSMCGAAYFSASAAYRCGAGVVEIFTERNNYSSLCASVPEAVFSLYGYDENADEVSERLRSAISHTDAIILGCGIGRSALSARLVETVLKCSHVPTVIDADALNIISENRDLRQLMADKSVIITPHPVEASRLSGKSAEKILSDTLAAARELANDLSVVCLLKDHHTVISDGKTAYVNHSGNAGMASAGMGDVLAGIIGALAAKYQSDISHSATAEWHGKTDNAMTYLAAVGAYLHGLCGDEAAGRVGQYSLVASDVLESIKGVLKKI